MSDPNMVDVFIYVHRDGATKAHHVQLSRVPTRDDWIDPDGLGEVCVTRVLHHPVAAETYAATAWATN